MTRRDARVVTCCALWGLALVLLMASWFAYLVDPGGPAVMLALSALAMTGAAIGAMIVRATGRVLELIRLSLQR